MMINRKKTAALMLGLTMGMTGNLMAAPAGADEAEPRGCGNAGKMC